MAGEAFVELRWGPMNCFRCQTKKLHST